ncbi:MAG: D-aminoacylase [Bacteroidetes bacterium]|nr:MAG: D-aminoacylase [Bacteroidota bacterium]
MKWVLIVGVLILSVFSCKQSEYDIVIENGLIYDGTGEGPYFADIAIKDGQIALIDKDITAQRKQTIDAQRKVVAPGFIDLHAHISPITLYPEAESFIRQGVTTTLGGPDGSSPLPMREYLDSLEELVTGVNVAYLVGHGSIRADVMGLEDRKPTNDELSLMKSKVVEAMTAGAFGISTGLKYLPGTFATTEEVIEISKEVSRYGGIYTSHMRDEGLKLIEGVNEIVRIADEADILVVLTHHKVIGKPMWGASRQTLAIVDSARAAGLDVMIDQYPYTASYTSISVLIPSWSLEGGRTKFAERCDVPELRDSIKRGIIFNIKYDRGGDDLRSVQIAKFDWKPHLTGKTLFDWAEEEGMVPNAANGAELVIQAQLHGSASCIYHVMDDEDIVRIMQHPQTMHASDGRLSVINKGHPHPRAFGTFPRVLGHYVRERQVLTLQQAIHKMTGMPASVLALKDRGLIQVGMHADITVFDAEVVIDKATFEDPNQFPEGIEYVIINGAVALSPNGLSGKRFGEVLRGAAYVEE